MARYYQVNGKRVPSVTTIIKRFGETEPLVHWAWQQGIDGKNYRETRDSAGDTGTAAHYCIQEHLRTIIEGRRFQIPGTDELVDRFSLSHKDALTSIAIWKRWYRWYSRVRPVISHVELPLICGEHLFGGTVDAVGILDGVVTVFDWKTGKGVYWDMVIQLAAYGHLIQTNGIYPGISKYILLHTPRTSDAITIYEPKPGTIDIALHQFFKMRQLYDGMKNLKNPWTDKKRGAAR